MNQLIQLHGDGYQIKATPEAEKLKIKLLKESATIKKVKDKGDEALALAAASELAAFRKQLEATRKSVKEPVLQLGRKIDSVAEGFGEEVSNEERRIKGLLGGYQMELEKERRRLQEEADAKAREAEKLAREAEVARLKAEKTNSTVQEIKAERLEAKESDARVESMQLSQQAENTRVRGGRMEWDFEVLDIDALNDERPDLVKKEAKTREIKEAMKRLEEQGKPVAIHGLRCFQKPVISVR